MQQLLDLYIDKVLKYFTNNTFIKSLHHIVTTKPVRTCGLISCKDAFSRSHYPLGDFLQLLLLLRSQCRVLVSHGG